MMGYKPQFDHGNKPIQRKPGVGFPTFRGLPYVQPSRYDHCTVAINMKF